MRILDTILHLMAYQQDMLDTDIPAGVTLEWCRRTHRFVGVDHASPHAGNVVRGHSGRVSVDEFGPILVDMLTYLPGADYPLTYDQALDQARQGCMVQCSFGGTRYLYHEDGDCLLCIDMEQPSDAERCCGWRIVPPDSEEVQP